MTFQLIEKQQISFLSFCLILAFFIACNTESSQGDDYRDSITAEIEEELHRKIDAWYPRVIDTEHGGYLTNFTYDWQPGETQNKMIVTQARHVWTLSKLAEKFPHENRFEEFASHGFQFLKDKMWDSVYGGFFQTVTSEGEPIANQQGEIQKTLYGNAFALYGMAALYKLSGDSEVFELAQKLFNWLDEHSYDPVYGGYFQPLARDGTPDRTGFPKDYNSGIHILEALTELYEAWPDELVKERLEEMFTIVRDTMVTEQGYLKLFFEEDWTHRSHRDSSKTVIMDDLYFDHVSPGHDIETAFLLLEAAHVLGIEDDETTLSVAKKLTDHTLETGWDSETGGFYEAGFYFKNDDHLTILNESKNWWAQAEALNTLMIMANLYPEDPENYFEKFVRQWRFIQNYLSDQEHGGWYNNALDKDPDSKTSMKSHMWKGNYHTIRALLGVLENLENKD